MDTSSPPDRVVADALDLAAAHGLDLSSVGAVVVDAGLDYRVVMADETTDVTPDVTTDVTPGPRWVLRVPRRADVSAAMDGEARVLDLVAPVLAAEGVAVPDWRVRSPRLVAYPALPGSPGLTLDGTGQPVWHLEPTSHDYAERLGRLLARLHSVTVGAARAAGVEARTPEQVRRGWRDDVARVRDAFDVAPALLGSWEDWLADDVCWPESCVMTHGEIYPAHVLLDDAGAVTGVLDWTTARIDDPARDLSAQYGAAGEEALQVTLDAYAAAGGHVHPGLARQARRLWEAAPLGYALYALVTGAEGDRATAAALLDPAP